MNNPKDNMIKNTIGTFCIAIFTAFGTAYLIDTNSGRLDAIPYIIMGILLTLVMFAAGIYGCILIYRDKNPDAMRDMRLKNKQEMKKYRVRQALMAAQTKYRTMEQEVFWISIKNQTVILVPCFLLVALYSALKFSQYDNSWMALYISIGLLLLVLLGVMLWNIVRGPRYYLLKEIERKGLDRRTVNDNYMHGITFPIATGLFNLSDEYSIFIREKNCFIVMTQDIRLVTAEYHSYTWRYKGVKNTQTQKELVIYTKAGKNWFPCPEMMCELIMEEYERRGIPVDTTAATGASNPSK